MTRVNVWSPCNRVLADKQRDCRLDAHRARLEEIHGSTSQSVSNLSSACPRGTMVGGFKALPKSKSPAAKARQAEIDRDNLKMIKKIVELQRKGGVSGGGGRMKKIVTASSKLRPTSASCKSRGHCGHLYEPNPLTGFAPGGDLGVPIAVSHPVYTRHSATMTHHFDEQNDIALNFVPGKRSIATTRQHSQVQIYHENRQILQRILSSKTTFSRAAWKAEELERRKLLSNISRFSHLPKRDSPPESIARRSPTMRPQHALSVVDCNDRHQDLSRGVRTGSPVTHLRHQLRPNSASAGDSRTRDNGWDCHHGEVEALQVIRRSDLDEDQFTHAMKALHFGHEDGDDGDDGGEVDEKDEDTGDQEE